MAPCWRRIVRCFQSDKDILLHDELQRLCEAERQHRGPCRLHVHYTLDEYVHVHDAVVCRATNSLPSAPGAAQRGRTTHGITLAL